MPEKVLKELGLEIPLVAVAKGPDRKNVKIQISSAAADKSNINIPIQKIIEDKNLVKSIMDEAHRFAITYHKKIRRKEFF